ncbi:MAG: DUF2513 domain-containing protein [Lachnospiraceae bacterium]
MKLKADCVRDVLLKLEDILLIDASFAFSPVDIPTLCSELPQYEPEDIYYTVYQLNQGKYIKAEITLLPSGGMRTSAIKTITWEGHEFIESIRPDTVWEEVKNTIQKIGALSVTSIAYLGKLFIETYISGMDFSKIF